MRRYNITATAKDEMVRTQHDITSAPREQIMRVPRIQIDEAFNGEWVRYEDAITANRLLRMVSANLHNPSLGGISEDQLAAIDEAIASGQ